MDIVILTHQVSQQENMSIRWVLGVEANLQVWEYFMLLDKFLKIKDYLKSLALNKESQEKK